MSIIKIPRKIIYATECGDKRAICFSYFALHAGLNDIALYYCNYLITWCGFKPKRDPGAINDKFKTTLEWMYQNGFIANDDATPFDRNKFSKGMGFVSKINRDWIYPNNNFGLIFDFELESIWNYSKKYRLNIDSRITHATLLLVLAYLRCNFRTRKKELYGDLLEMKKCPEIFYHFYADIAGDLGLLERVVSKCVDILCQLDIIVKYNMPRFKDDNGNWHTDPTIFASKYKYQMGTKGEYILDETYFYEKEIEYGKKLILSKPHMITIKR